MCKINNNKVRDFEQEELTNIITDIINNSGYKLVNLKIDKLHFGNIIVELVNDKGYIRFVQDRGEIITANRAIGSKQWGREELVCGHNKNSNGKHSLLVSAIADMIGSCLP